MADYAETLSTALESDALSGASGAGAPALDAAPEPKAETPAPSMQDSIKEAMAESEKETAASDDANKDDDAPEGEKVEKDEKEPAKPEAKEAPVKERQPDGKFAPKAKEGEVADEGEKPEAKGNIEAPAKFLPDAKEKWINTPRSVQRDVENMVREHETEMTRYKEAAERYETIRHYDDAVRQSGRAGIHETLAEVSEVSEMLEKRPMAALNYMLLNHGPRKADGSPVSLLEAAQAIVAMNQQQYQQAVSRQPSGQQQPQADPRVQQLEQQVVAMQAQQISMAVIEPFKAAHPRYNELEPYIASFLKSDMIPTSLSLPDRLAAAYDMAERINPPSRQAAPAKADLDPGDRVDDPSSGTKSIKSAPGAISPEMEPERGGSIKDVLQREMRRQAVR